MKTTVFYQRNIPQFAFIGFLCLLISSCGSYQNSSYYETDGVYGSNSSRVVYNESQNTSGNQYQEYFRSLQNTNSSSEIFTDVESYNNYEDVNDSIQAPNTGYASWGSNPQSTTIYINDIGWNNWYGAGWGWNNPWGWTPLVLLTMESVSVSLSPVCEVPV